MLLIVILAMSFECSQRGIRLSELPHTEMHGKSIPEPLSAQISDLRVPEDEAF